MIRMPTLASVLACLLLACLPLHPAGAATKKSSSKKSSSSTKKKPASAATSDVTAGGKKAGSELDLPLPAKPASTDKESVSVEKKAAEKPAPAEPPGPKSGTEAATGKHAPNATVEPDDLV